MAQEDLEVKLRIVLDNGIVKAMAQVGDQLKEVDEVQLKLNKDTAAGVKATDDLVRSLQKRVDAAKKAGAERAYLDEWGYGRKKRVDPTLDERVARFARSSRERAELEDELTARGLKDGPRLPRGPKAPRSVDAEVWDRIQRQDRRRAVEDRLDELGYGKPEPAGPAFAATALRALGRTGVAAAAAGVQSAAAFGRIEAGGVYLSDRGRFEARTRSLPLGVGAAVGETVDALRYATGESRETRAVLSGAENARLAERERAERGRFFDREQLGQDVRSIRSRVLGGVNYSGFAGNDRGTTIGRQLDREDEALLETRHKVQRAEGERKAAAEKAALYARRDAELAKDSNELQLEIYRLTEAREKAGRKGGRQVDELEAGADEVAARNRKKNVDQQRMDILERKREADEELADRSYDLSSSRSQLRMGEYANLRQREAVASDQAASAIFAGPEGRMRAKAAFDMIRGMGIENAPAELIGQASGLFGDELRTMAEEATARRPDLIGGLRERAPGQYRDDVRRVREEADRARQEGVDAQRAADAELEAAGSRVGQAFLEKMAPFFEGFLKTISETEKANRRLEAIKGNVQGR